MEMAGHHPERGVSKDSGGLHDAYGRTSQTLNGLSRSTGYKLPQEACDPLAETQNTSTRWKQRGMINAPYILGI